MTLKNDIATLQLYNDLAAELNHSSFLNHVKSSSGTSFRFETSPFRILPQGQPSDEALKAFLLTFRLFIQERDDLSFRAIAKLLTESPIQTLLKREIVEIQEEVDDYLTRPSPFEIYGERISRGALLSTLMYGRLAHVNREKRATLERWTVRDDAYPMFRHEFEVIVIRLAQEVFWVRQVNLQAIVELNALLEA